MFGFLKKLFGKGDSNSVGSAAAVGQTPTTPGATAAVPGAVDQVGAPAPTPVVTPVVPSATPPVAS